MVVHGLLVPLLGPPGGGGVGGGGETYLVPALLPRSGPAWPLPAGASAPQHRAVLLFARRGELAAWRRRGYVTAAEAAAEGLLPDGVFARSWWAARWASAGGRTAAAAARRRRRRRSRTACSARRWAGTPSRSARRPGGARRRSCG